MRHSFAVLKLALVLYAGVRAEFQLNNFPPAGSSSAGTPLPTPVPPAK